jgi:hypothetical protein
MTDLNTAIAFQQGWILRPYEKLGSMYEPSVKWYNPKTNQSLYTHDPDYEQDARLYMALFEEFPVGTSLVKMLDGYMVRNFGADIDAQLADEKGTAICFAYCRLKGIEVVG